nr:MAG TPA: hypothetical protein [Caudoviricetes sp.]
MESIQSVDLIQSLLLYIIMNLKESENLTRVNLKKLLVKNV